MKARSDRFAKGAPNPAELARMLPTPVASDAAAGGIIGKDDEFYATKSGAPRRISKSGVDGSVGLARFVRLYPTPTANDAKNTLTESQIGRGALTARIAEAKKLRPAPRAFMHKDSPADRGRANLGEKVGGQLNPDWVEPLMGYPAGWTDVETDASLDSDFPESWLDGTWEEGVPRTTEKIKNRVKRLKCLGNAVVPQIPELLWRLIMGRIACT